MPDMYYKQVKMYNPERDKQPTIHIYGAGSIGSHVTIGLAKTGFKLINVYDYDEIEESNLPAQNYPATKVGQKKVRAIYEHVINMTNIIIHAYNTKITDKTQISTNIGDIHIMCLDNIETRKLIYEALKEQKKECWLIDGRIGGFNYQIYTINMKEPQKKMKEYEKTLEGEFSEQECGNKTLWAVNSLISAKIIAQILKIIKDGWIPYRKIIGHLMNENSIAEEMYK